MALKLRLALGRCRIAHALIEKLPARFPVGRNSLEQRDQIRGADYINRSRVYIRRKGHTCQRGVAAIRTTHDADALRISDAFGDQIFRAPGNVVLHLIAPLFVASIEKLLSIAGGGAEVWLEHCVTAIGEKLGK